MAEFCFDCTRDVLGMDPKDNDFKGLCQDGYCIPVICEGCDPEHHVTKANGETSYMVFVDHRGKRLDFTKLASEYAGPKGK
jgi:hypothetical protein